MQGQDAVSERAEGSGLNYVKGSGIGITAWYRRNVPVQEHIREVQGQEMQGLRQQRV